MSFQIFSGSLLWLLISNSKSTTVPELLGLGVAFGSLLSLLAVSAFRTTSVRDISWLFPTFILLFMLSYPAFRHKVLCCNIEKTDSRDVAFLFSSSILALSLFWVWALPLIVVPFAFCTFKNRRLHLSIIALSIAAVIGSQLLKSSTTSWWIFSHDQMYLEGLGEGIYRYGQHDNMHLAGYGFPYHWFSLLWSATISHAANLPPLVALAKILPIVSIFTCVNLLWIITRQHSKLAGYFSIIGFAIGSNAIDWTAIRFISSPTFLFSIIWLLAFAFIFQRAVSSTDFRLEIALGLLLIGAFGGKVTHGIIILGGLGFAAVVDTFRNRSFKKFRRLLRMYALLLIATIAVYLLVYRGQTVGGRMLYVSPGELGFQVGIAYMSSSQWIWIAATVAVLIGCSTPLVISLIKVKRSESHHVFDAFCIGSFLISLPLTFFLAQDGGSQGYFLLSASVIILIPASIALAQRVELSGKLHLSQRSATMIFIGAVYCFIVVYFWNSTPDGIDQYRFGLAFKVGAAIIPMLAFATIRIFLGRKNINIGLLLLVSVFLFFGVFHRTSTIESYFKNFSENARTEAISGTRDRVAALTWLRNNSHEDDVIATNRFCIPGSDPCDSKWYLVSAISQRRMLVEGSREPVNEFAAQIGEKTRASIEFANSPDLQIYNFFIMNSVDWFVVDAVVGGVITSWEPYAKVVFQNSEMKILKLADHL